MLNLNFNHKKKVDSLKNYLEYYNMFTQVAIIDENKLTMKQIFEIYDKKTKFDLNDPLQLSVFKQAIEYFQTLK